MTSNLGKRSLSVRGFADTAFIPNLDQKSLESVNLPAYEEGQQPSGGEGIALSPSRRLDDFIAAAAAAGLRAPEAARLAIERSLALHDAAPLGLDIETCRRTLSCEARRARPGRTLTPRQSTWLRTLCMGRPVAAVEANAGLTVPLPDRLLIRAADEVRARALHASVVPEMIQWEIAATLEGRTMGEWALHTLALATVRSRP